MIGGQRNPLEQFMARQAEMEDEPKWVRGAGVGHAPTYTLSSSNTTGATYMAASSITP